MDDDIVVLDYESDYFFYLVLYYILTYRLVSNAGRSFSSQAKIAVTGESSTYSQKTIPCLGLAVSITVIDIVAGANFLGSRVSRELVNCKLEKLIPICIFETELQISDVSSPECF